MSVPQIFEIRVLEQDKDTGKWTIAIKDELVASDRDDAKLRFVQGEHGRSLDLDIVQIVVRPFLQ